MWIVLIANFGLMICYLRGIYDIVSFNTVILDLLSKSNTAGIDNLSGISIKDGAEKIAFLFTKIRNLSIRCNLSVSNYLCYFYGE